MTCSSCQKAQEESDGVCATCWELEALILGALIIAFVIVIFMVNKK